MKDKYELFDRPSCQIKYLVKESEDDGIGIYKLDVRWKAEPETEASYRVGGDFNTNQIEFLDFDGGPFMTRGYKVAHNIEVVDFLEAGKVVLKNTDVVSS